MRRTLWSLAAAVALLAALLGVRQWGALFATSSRYVFDTAAAASITRLEVSLAGDSVTLVKKPAKGGGLWVVLPDSFPVDTARLSFALARVLRLEDKELVSKSSSESRLAEFGLTPSERKVIRWSGAQGASTVVHLGHTSGTDFNSTYWKRPGSAEVYRTPGNFTHEIGVFARDWKDKSLFPAFAPEDVRSLEVRWDDTLGRAVYYALTAERDSTYRLASPDLAGPVIMPRPTATSLVAAAAGLAFDETPDHDDPERGLADVDSPSVMIKVTLRDGASHALVTGGRSGISYYLRHPVHRGVGKIFQNRVAPFLKTPARLRLPVPDLSRLPAGEVEIQTIGEPGDP